MLRQSYGARHLDIKAPLQKRKDHDWIDAEDVRRARRIYPRLQGICGHRVTSFCGLEDAAPDVRYFTFVRKPLDRFVSHFHHFHRDTDRTVNRDNFLEFCADPHQRNVQCRWIGGRESSDDAARELEQRIGFVGLTEEFETSVILFERWMNCPGFQARYRPRNLKPNRLPFDPLQDTECVEAARDANAGDIELYEAVTADVFPRQMDEYGYRLEAAGEQLRARNNTFRDPGEPVWARAKRNWMYKPLLHLGWA